MAVSLSYVIKSLYFFPKCECKKLNNWKLFYFPLYILVMLFIFSYSTSELLRISNIYIDLSTFTLYFELRDKYFYFANILGQIHQKLTWKRNIIPVMN